MIQRKQSSNLDFDLINDFRGGYRSREDITNLPVGILVAGSQNVVTNTANRLGVVKGYTLDGQANSDLSGIISSFDYFTSKGYERNLRSYIDATTGNAVLQYRYIDSSNIVTWRDLIGTSASETSASFNFTEFWDFTTEKLNLLLFVNGTSYVFEWGGGITTIASVGANTLTKQGTTTWAEEGFYLAETRQVVIGGVTYTYTGGEGTTTLTGVTPDPALAAPAIAAGDICHQQYRKTANSAITSLPATFANSLIATLRNQVYIGDLKNSSVYISKVNNYKDFSFTSPTRVVREGGLITLDNPPVAFAPQESDMYVSSGKDFWFKTKFTLSSDLTKEAFEIEKLKTASRQGAFSQAATNKDKNNVIFISNEPVLTTIGRVANNLATPQAGDISYPIVNDFNAYDFTDCHVKYHKNFIYVTVPKEGVVRIYNQTLADRHYWEAPVTYPVGRLSVIDGELYGHSYNTPETYKLFTGYNFNGAPIPALAAFSYNNFGTRARSKGFNQVYVEGYISQNGDLNLGLKKEVDGCATVQEFTIEGDQQPPIVCQGGSSAPIGKESIGYNPIGSQLVGNGPLPPKFRVIKTMSPDYFYEMQFSFYSVLVDFQWEILCFGTAILPASDLNTSIKQ